MEKIFEEIEQLIQDNALVPQGSGVVVGVSGGPDSMALLALLVRMRRRCYFPIMAAHVHHGLRANADLDEALVEAWCQSNQVAFRCLRVKLLQRAEHMGLGLEEAGRIVRREFFEQCRRELQTQLGPASIVRIALAHHIQDQAETVLLNLGRGSGLDGLAGMKLLDDPYIRPLLRLDPSVIRQWLENESIPWREDESNDDLRFARNRIRHRLLPIWRETLGYDPVRMIARAADNLAADRDWLNTQSDTVFEALYIERVSPDNLPGLECAGLAEMPLAVQVRLLRRFFKECTGSARNVTRQHLDQMRMTALESAGPFDLPGAVRVKRRGPYLHLETSRSNPPVQDDNWIIPLNLPGRTQLPQGYGFIRADVIEYNSDFRYNSQMNCFDAASLKDCSIRLRQVGDRISPVGRGGHRTLKKIMNELKIPPEIRARLPLVAKGQDVAWIPGYVCGHEFCFNSCSDETDDRNDGQARKFGIRLVWEQEQQTE